MKSQTEIKEILKSKQADMKNYTDKIASGFWKEASVKGLMNKLQEQIDFFTGKLKSSAK